MTTHPISNPASGQRIVREQRDGDWIAIRTCLRSWTDSGPCGAAYALATFTACAATLSVVVLHTTTIASPAMCALLVVGWVAFVHLVRWMTWVDRTLCAGRLEADDHAVSGEPTAARRAPGDVEQPRS